MYWGCFVLVAYPLINYQQIMPKNQHIVLYAHGSFLLDLESILHSPPSLLSADVSPFPAGAQKLYSGFKPRPGPKRGADQPVGPISYEPYGRRFSITRGNKVDWLGWSLYTGAMPSSGPRLFDVRFKGQRIAYEVSMQEALAGKLGGYCWKESR
jgi:hypothetical protein